MMSASICTRVRPQMAFRSRSLDPIREILDSAERLDLTLSGGAILHDDELDLYVDTLLGYIYNKFKDAVVVGHHERTASGVVITVIPPAKTTAVYLFCKKQVDL